MLQVHQASQSKQRCISIAGLISVEQMVLLFLWQTMDLEVVMVDFEKMNARSERVVSVDLKHAWAMVLASCRISSDWDPFEIHRVAGGAGVDRLS